MRGSFFFAFCLIALQLLGPRIALSSPETAGQAPRVVLEAELSPDGASLVGTIRIDLINHSSSTLKSIPLFLYPNRFARPNPDLDDRDIRWIYPAAESAGRMEIESPTWNGSPLPEAHISFEPLVVSDKRPVFEKVIAKVKLKAPLGPGERGVLGLCFRVTIPKRRGRFGRYRGVVSLGGGWFPRPLCDLTGSRTDSPPCPLDIEARVTLAKRRGAVLLDQVFPLQETAQTVSVKRERVDVVSLVVMDLMDITSRTFPWGTAVLVRRDLEKDKPPWKASHHDHNGLPQGLPDLGRTDTRARLFSVADNSVRLLRKLCPDLTTPIRLVFTSIPAWDYLVQLGPGQILLSDRLYKLVPVEQALWFHDLAVARGVGALIAHQEPLAAEEPRHRFVVADLVGSHLAIRYTEEVHRQSRTVEDLVGFAGFVPTIDNLLYAPEVPFREVYSKSVEEPDPLRDEPWRFANELPRGKRIYGKLVDLRGQAWTEKLVKKILKGKKGFVELLQRQFGQDPSWFIEQWYGPYPEVAYRLGHIDDGKTGKELYRHRVEIVREGEAIREPVTVRVTDEKGVTKDLVWPGIRQRGYVAWTSRSPLKKVEIDPSHRLVESANLSDEHPLSDNSEPLSWRPPMITRILFSGDLTAGDPYVSFGMSLRRRYEVTNSFALSAVYTPRSYGGSLGYYRYFGPKRTLNARTWFAGASLGAHRYLEVTRAGPEIPEDTRFAATAGSLGLVVGRDNRSYFFDPRSGLGFWVSLSYSAGRDDDGRGVQLGQLSGAVVLVGSPAIRHTFALHLGAMGIVGTPAAAQLPTLSVRSILRGFDPGETYGRAGCYAVGEYRHALVDAAHIATPAFSWFDRLQGVLFVAGGTMTLPGSYTGLFSSERLFSEVGYGLRLHTLAMGVQQYVIGLDFAFPLTPRMRRFELEGADGTISYVQRTPFKLILGILQTF